MLLPKDVLRDSGVHPGDKIDVSAEDEDIVLRKTLTGSPEDLLDILHGLKGLPIIERSQSAANLNYNRAIDLPLVLFSLVFPDGRDGTLANSARTGYNPLMPKINLTVPHKLGQDEAKNRLARLIADSAPSLPTKSARWPKLGMATPDAFSFDAMGFSVKGTLDVHPDQVLIELSLPMASPFKGRIGNETHPRPPIAGLGDPSRPKAKGFRRKQSWKFVRPYAGKLILATGSMSIGAVSGLVLPLLTGQVIDATMLADGGACFQKIVLGLWLCASC